MPTFDNLERAAALGCNLFVTHEPLYVAVANKYDIFIGGPIRRWDLLPEGTFVDEDHVWVRKARWLQDHEMTVVRCHDVWDDFPETGIHGAWAKWLGFIGTPVATRKFYEVHEFPRKSVGELAKSLLPRLRALGQETIHLVGDEGTQVSKIALGTGAITDYRVMREMGADVLLLTDDGTRLWESAQWALDEGIPLLVVNHATAEEPGVRQMAAHFREQFPAVPVHALERGCLYHSLPAV
jgi:putative NIF3 family GTP cyclohydrolase 1 type 2